MNLSLSGRRTSHLSVSWKTVFKLLLVSGMLPLFLTAVASAQSVSDTLELGPLNVSSTRISVPLDRQPVFVNQLDSATLYRSSQQSIAELLARRTSMDIKSYGGGGSATISQRGMEADQTKVLWNGMPMNTSFLGLTDFALLDTEMFSQIQVTPGNMSTAFGGRSIGGTVSLVSDIPSEMVSLSQSVGSYGYNNSIFKGGIDHKAWSVGIIAQRQQSDNNYRYQNPFAVQRDIDTLTNNRLSNNQVMAGVERQSLGGLDIRSILWWNQTRHQIPGSIIAGSGSARQYDESVRWLNTVKQTFHGWRIRGKGYYNNYELNYVDDKKEINSKTRSERVRLHVDARKVLSQRFTLNLSTGSGWTRVRTNNYDQDPTRRTVSLQANPVLELSKDIYVYPALRLDHYSDFGTAVSPSLGANWKLDGNVILRGSAGYNFSPPTFNDLYWVPGGNPDLKAERSRKAEVGLQVGQADEWWGQHDLNLYYMTLKNGIQWRQLETGFWSPRNVRQMVSTGATWRSTHQVEIRSAAVQWNQIVDWTRTLIRRKDIISFKLDGNQLAYIPKWSYKSNLLIKFQKFYVSGNYRWTGIRYTDNSHQSQLDPYWVVDLSAGYQHNWGPFRVSAQLRAENITDTDYQMIKWYPMPGRNYRFSLSLTYTL